MKRCPSSSSSSSSSSSCIESPIPQNTPIPTTPKRLRTKKNLVTPTSATSPKSRSSVYRGVTRHRWTGRYEAHLWDKTTWNTIQNKRGRQIYLGAYDNEEDAARTYDLAALKYWGPTSILNFPVEMYAKEVEEMEKLTKEEHLASLRRRSSGFSRGVSKYRGVARHHHNGRWEARIGRVCGNKYLYLGTFSTQEEAAAAYDLAAIKFRGSNAVTNFHISNYASKTNKLQVKLETDQALLEKSPSFDKPTNDDDDNNDNKDHDKAIPQDVLKPVATTPPIDPQATITMDHVEDHDNPWNMCLDIGFHLPIPDIPLEKTFEVFDYEGFEDDIECIFDGPFCDVGQDALLGDHGQTEVDFLVVPDMKLTSPLSGSTTTTVCGNV